VAANINPDTGKYNGYVTSWVPLELRRPDYQYTDIPCGKCRGCRLDYAREWANRMFLEAALSPDDSCWFVTLTYDDAHIPFSSPSSIIIFISSSVTISSSFSFTPKILDITLVENVSNFTNGAVIKDIPLITPIVPNDTFS